MFTYTNIINDDSTTLTSKEYMLEIELIKQALDVYARINLFEERSIQNLKWFLKKLFSFEFEVIEINSSSYEIILNNGGEKFVLQFSIKNSSI